MDEASLGELIRAARRREPAALARLVDAYSPRVFGLLYQLVGSADTAEELLQETFLRLVRMIDRYEHEGRFDSWLFRIAANLARDHARQQRRRRSGLTLDADTEARSDAGPIRAAGRSPDEWVVLQEDASRLEAALRRLSGPEREILALRHFGELSFKEIAALLRIPLGTALARAHRALGRLRAEMGE